MKPTVAAAANALLMGKDAEASPSAAPAAEVLSNWRRLSMNLSVISYAPLWTLFQVG
ncbi:exported hypothetical protein [Mesorhizobium metallidurans STM 2683]|uniref:Uncharacterized protein n=1 Tax=Mesorhizobium metallidurans STM 2683 TaxID=1297569 RepID=M5EXP6_9HYPH|nr:exported hypothetical protein [Mesorhizobium metallidurans STM 2683]